MTGYSLPWRHREPGRRKSRLMYIVRGLLVATALAVSGSTALAEPPATPPPATAVSPTIAFTKYVLNNGLEVILHEDHSLPLVAINLWYHVGPANEPEGRSGFAHLFEHLMFEGSRHVGRELDRLLEAAGATNVNGTTSWDRTNYFETVPREQLELVLWIESDRMGFMLDTLTQERLDVQRSVVKNERRQSYENAPYGPSTLALLDTLFPKGHPYHGAVIGSMQDLSAATLQDVRDFFESFYAPSNATLTLAGDFEPHNARALIDRYFGSLPDRPKPKAVSRDKWPAPDARERVIEEPVELAKVAMGWRAPPAFGADDPVLDVAMAVLAGGKATRMYQTLVVEKKLASEVDASLDSNAIDSMVGISALVASGKSVDALKKAMEQLLDELIAQGPKSDELERAKRRILLGIKSSLQLLNGPGGESGRAGFLQRMNHYLKDPGRIDEWLAQIERVTAADIQRALREHLVRQERVLVITRPKAKAANSSAGEKK
jgi:zinc protease